MIIVDVRIEGQRKMQRLKFMDGYFPRIGETVALGSKRYKIAALTHKFYYADDILGSYHNERYFIAIPGLEITLKK